MSWGDSFAAAVKAVTDKGLDVAATVNAAVDSSMQAAQDAAQTAIAKSVSAGRQAVDTAAGAAQQAYGAGKRAAEQAYDTGTRAAQQAYQTGAKAAKQAYDKGTELAGKAYDRGTALASKAYDAGARAASQAYDAGVQAATAAKDFAVDAGQRAWAVGKGAAATVVGTVGVVGAAAVGGTAVAAAGAYNKARELFSDTQPALLPLTQCASVEGESADARKARILKRQALIAQGKQSPATREAAERLERDMKSVELARLSAHVYTHYDEKNPANTNAPSPLPQPWKVASDEELKAMKLPPGTVQEARAAVYVLPSDFPFDPKTVVAFRGTTGETEDILTDHDNALGRETKQYTASVSLGEALGAMKPPRPMVTGHSLGGGKAQAAVVGANGWISGEMFNSAGLHPAVVDRTPQELARFEGLCNQQRTTGGLSVGGGDPLTGLQMSPVAQKVAYGTAAALGTVAGASRDALEAVGMEFSDVRDPDKEEGILGSLGRRISTVTADEAAANQERYGWYVPPTLGQASTQSVVSKNADGTDTGLAAQHSIVNMVNGYESRKIGDVQTLAKAAGTREPLQSLIGPAR